MKTKAHAQYRVEKRRVPIDEEQWTILKDFPAYAISNYGRVKRVLPGVATQIGRLLSPWVSSNGYAYVDLWKNNTRYRFKVHQLIASTFIGPCPKGKEINHKDGIKINNIYNNLEYVTHKQNSDHAHKLGLIQHAKGKDHPQATITHSQVKKTKRLKNQGYSDRYISKQLGISKGTVYSIIKNLHWRCNR